jgi:putative ABC transport system ATP-binding protein
VGRLLGDPEVWDDSPSRPRPALRGLVGLAIGAAAGPGCCWTPSTLGDAASKPIRALSGGEQQRLAVAVALANNPPLLLADEPTSQLDRANVRRVVELLKEARDDLGTTVVVVTHDAEVAAAMDRAVTIRDGRVSAEGRGGAEYAVVGPTGSLHLPAHALDVLPPGARVELEVNGDQVVLKPTDGGNES